MHFANTVTSFNKCQCGFILSAHLFKGERTILYTMFFAMVNTKAQNTDCYDVNYYSVFNVKPFFPSAILLFLDGGNKKSLPRSLSFFFFKL